ncbi:hypothetical protein FRC10_009700 [Ceratobasidium sp. 414]|nr:hypothetical protein FRC10_009700 [Ceratobasidium sp. 414]
MSGQPNQGATPDNSQASPGNTTVGSFTLTPDRLSAIVSSAVQVSVSQVQNLQSSHQRASSKVESRKAKSLRVDIVPTQAQRRRTVGLLGHLDGSSQQPDGTSARALDKWVQEDAAGRSTIVGALGRDVTYRYLEGIMTASEAWDTLERHYKTSNTASLMAIDKDPSYAGRRAHCRAYSYAEASEATLGRLGLPSQRDSLQGDPFPLSGLPSLANLITSAVPSNQVCEEHGRIQRET